MKQYLALILVATVTFCAAQEKERNYQLEFSGGYFQNFNRSPYRNYHLGVGINIPGKKDNWYTNYAIDVNHSGRLNSYFGNDFYSLSAGKHYQFKKNKFYSSLGMNAGLFLAHNTFSTPDNPVPYLNSGIAIIPRAEIGLNTERFIISTGAYMSLGYGYGYDNYSQNQRQRFSFSGCFTPYVKFTLK